MNCVLIEDEYIIRLHVKNMLTKQGIHVETESTTQEDAIKAIMTYKPDLVLVDVQLKHGGTGIEVVKYCKPLFESRYIFMTAYSDETLDDITNLGCEYLIKPFEQEILVERLQKEKETFLKTK